MKEKKKIYVEPSKEPPVIVYDYPQVILLDSLAKAFQAKQEVFTEMEAAEYLRVPLQTLKNYAKKKKITWRLVGKQKQYTKTDLDEFLERKSRLHRDF